MANSVKYDIGSVYKEYAEHRRINDTIKDILVQQAKQLENELVKKKRR